MSRLPLIAGNWKMYKTQSESVALIQLLRERVDDHSAAEILVCPPFTSLAAVSEALQGSSIKLGGQNVGWADEGAFTGEISAKMLLDCGCQYALIGHSERRQYFNETDENVARRLAKVLNTPLSPILCAGEQLQDRETGRVEDVVLGQLEQAVDQLTESELSKLVVAYEPVWAIGTGRTATPETAQQVHAMIREWLREVFSQELSARIRILYGGSVKPENIGELMAQPDIDGVLVGGASLEADSFARIIQYNR